MKIDGFGRSAVFAAVAAAGWLPWALFVAPLVGVWDARALYLVATAAAYVGLLPRRRTKGFGLAVVVLVIGIVVAGTVRTTAELALALAALVGVARGVFLRRAAPARAAATEVMLLGGGLLFARFLGGASLLATALALWGFLLAQSLFFLVAGGRSAPSARREADPFERAYRTAQALLDRAGP